MLLRFRVFEQTISAYPTKSEPRQGSVEYLQLQFIFSDDWKDLGKTLYFQSGEYSTPIEMKSDTVTVPEYYTEQTRFSVTLFGKLDEVEVPTNVVEVQLLESNQLWVSDAPTPQPSWIEDLIDLNDHPPYPGDAGYWMTWDLESGAYVQSQLPLPPVAEGPPGKAATIQVGTTTTGEPGAEATVQNVGNENAAILNFTVPAGPAGPTGTTPDISVRVSGLPAGSEPTVSVSGTPEAPVIYLGIPAGQQGTPGTPGTNGTDGTDGQTPNITIGTVETLPAGSDVTVSITGQTPNLVLNLGIPQGPAGAGVPPTDTAQAGDVPTWDGQNVVWAPPSGGGGGEAARLVIDDTTTEAAAYLYYNQDSDGNPFDYQHIIVFVAMPTPPDPAATKRGFWIRYDDGHVGPDSAQYHYTGAANSNTIAYGRVLNAEIQILELENKCYISFDSKTGSTNQLYVMNRGSYISPSKIGEVKFLMSDSSLIPAGTRVCIWAVG